MTMQNKSKQMQRDKKRAEKANLRRADIEALSNQINNLDYESKL